MALGWGYIAGGIREGIETGRRHRKEDEDQEFTRLARDRQQDEWAYQDRRRAIVDPMADEQARLSIDSGKVNLESAQYNLDETIANRSIRDRGHALQLEGAERENRVGAATEKARIASTNRANDKDARAYARQIEDEGVKDAVKLVLGGDLQGATELFNKTGKWQITPGSLAVDRDTGMVSWESATPGTEGQRRQARLADLATVAGVTLADAYGEAIVGDGGGVYQTNLNTGKTTAIASPSTSGSGSGRGDSKFQKDVLSEARQRQEEASRQVAKVLGGLDTMGRLVNQTKAADVEMASSYANHAIEMLADIALETGNLAYLNKATSASIAGRMIHIANTEGLLPDQKRQMMAAEVEKMIKPLIPQRPQGIPAQPSQGSAPGKIPTIEEFVPAWLQANSKSDTPADRELALAAYKNFYPQEYAKYYPSGQ